MDTRIPSHIEVSGLIRQVEMAGGFGMVLQKGEASSGAIMVILMENGQFSRAFERMPQLDGTRSWHCIREEKPNESATFTEFIQKRSLQDPDLWVIELDIANGERFIGLTNDSY